MTSPPDTIESYIHKTLSQELKANERVQENTVSQIVRDDQRLRDDLQRALDRDDKKTAIKIA